MWTKFAVCATMAVAVGASLLGSAIPHESREMPASAGTQYAPILPVGTSTGSSLILYIQPIHSDPGGYNIYAMDVVRNLYVQRGASRVQVVLWPEEADPSKIRVWSGEDWLRDSTRLQSALVTGRADVDARGFALGLQTCKEILRKQKDSELVILTHELDDLRDANNGNATALKKISKENLVHLIAYDTSAGELTKALSGFLVSISRGGIRQEESGK